MMRGPEQPPLNDTKADIEIGHTATYLSTPTDPEVLQTMLHYLFDCCSIFAADGPDHLRRTQMTVLCCCLGSIPCEFHVCNTQLNPKKLLKPVMLFGRHAHISGAHSLLSSFKGPAAAGHACLPTQDLTALVNH